MIDREKVAETMIPCDSYSGWAAKYLRGDFDFTDLWKEVKGIQAEIVPGKVDASPVVTVDEEEVEDEPEAEDPRDAEIERLRGLLTEQDEQA